MQIVLTLLSKLFTFAVGFLEDFLGLYLAHRKGKKDAQLEVKEEILKDAGKTNKLKNDVTNLTDDAVARIVYDNYYDDEDVRDSSK